MQWRIRPLPVQPSFQGDHICEHVASGLKEHYVHHISAVNAMFHLKILIKIWSLLIIWGILRTSHSPWLKSWCLKADEKLCDKGRKVMEQGNIHPGQKWEWAVKKMWSQMKSDLMGEVVLTWSGDYFMISSGFCSFPRQIHHHRGSPHPFYILYIFPKPLFHRHLSLFLLFFRMITFWKFYPFDFPLLLLLNRISSVEMNQFPLWSSLWSLWTLKSCHDLTRGRHIDEVIKALW